MTKVEKVCTYQVKGNNSVRRGRGGVPSPRNTLPRSTGKNTRTDCALIAQWSASVDTGGTVCHVELARDAGECGHVGQGALTGAFSCSCTEFPHFHVLFFMPRGRKPSSSDTFTSLKSLNIFGVRTLHIIGLRGCLQR